MRPELLASLNSALPDDIRIASAFRPLSSFDAQTTAFARTYKYFVPLSAVDHNFELFCKVVGMYQGSHNFHNFTTAQFRRESVPAVTREGVPLPGDPATRAQPGFDDFDLYADELFTSTQLWRFGAAAKRFVYSVSCEPTSEVLQGVPMAVVTLTASSFMMHQIRHMMGLAIAVARGIVPLEFVSAALSLPRCPGTTP